MLKTKQFHLFLSYDEILYGSFRFVFEYFEFIAQVKQINLKEMVALIKNLPMPIWEEVLPEYVYWLIN